MKLALPTLFSLLLAPCLAGSASAAADDSQLQRLLSCEDSWLDWRGDRARMGAFARDFQSRFTQEPRSPAFTPKQKLSLLGLPVEQVFPESVGMGVGFSVQVNAPAEQVRQALEQRLGKSMKCEVSEGTLACELEIGEKRTAILMTADKGRGRSSLLGCYYFYAP
ncbi:MAG: hypothetical protein IV092_24015 [Burkholderiaceae bacterium]|nr:hypothetical protein [Burkholderiaceae bacterium]